MVDRCNTHRKEFVGSCMWCGKRLCELCVAVKDRSKLYCEKCAGQLSSFGRARVPPATQLPVERPEMQLPDSSGRMPKKQTYVVDADGYFVLE